MKNICILTLIIISFSRCAISQTNNLYIIKPNGTFLLQNSFNVETLENGSTHYVFAGLPVLLPAELLPPFPYQKVACTASTPGVTITCGPFVESIVPGGGSSYFACMNSNSWQCSKKEGNITTINTDCAN